MSKTIRLIVGLGNPGPEYQSTRHNAGAIFLDQLAQQCHQILKPEKKFHGLYAKIKIQNQDLHLLFPSTYMNRSGQAVQAICQFFKISLEEILVVHDDIDIPLGTLKLKQNGGHGGNNGLRDIISRFGGEKNFNRLRLGIGHPGRAEEVTGHVLGKLNKKENEQLSATTDEAIRYLPEIINGEWQKAMNHLHGFVAL